MPLSNPDRLQAALWIGLGILLLWLLAKLAPILSPFLLAGILAYIGNPLVDRLQSVGVPRAVGALAVILGFFAVTILLILMLVPLLRDEAVQLANRIPDAVALYNEKIVPWIRERFGLNLKLRLDPASLRKLATENWDSIQTIAQQLYGSLKIGGIALVGLLANLFLAPVVMFYLLLDWHPLLQRLANVVPRPWYPKTRAMAADVDAVLSEFLRGQILVMLALAAYYVLGLWVAGLDYAVPVGVMTGLLVFVPYLGYATGFVLALATAILQFEGWPPILGTLAVFGFGQALEGFVLTPRLVGERIGLHPLAVIFALMAFGQLFGFFGVLLALPASAALLVGLREVRRSYLGSHFYRGRP